MRIIYGRTDTPYKSWEDVRNTAETPRCGNTALGAVGHYFLRLSEIEKVRRGKDPKCVVRDPEKNKIILIPAYEKWVPESEFNLAATAAVG